MTDKNARALKYLSKLYTHEDQVILISCVDRLSHCGPFCTNKENYIQSIIIDTVTSYSLMEVKNQMVWMFIDPEPKLAIVSID